MKDNQICVGIMSVGSGVGQSVINSLNLSGMPIKTVGLGINPFAYGGYECDVMDYLPLIYSDDYAEEVIKKCEEHLIDIIIPGSDDEALILSQYKQRLINKGIEILVADEEFIKLTRDKALMCNQLNKEVNIFVKSYSIQEIKVAIKNGEVNFPLIAKPRDGFASEGIEILLSEQDLIHVTEDHIIQELAVPNNDDPLRNEFDRKLAKKLNTQISEISIQVLLDQKGNLQGKMATYNKLRNGIPIEIIPYENDDMWNDIEALIPKLTQIGAKGPINIQGRMTDDGLKLFEINPRFTGITGLRAMMGFNEVEQSVKTFLNLTNDNDLLDYNANKFGIRQTADKVISVDANKVISNMVEEVNGDNLNNVKKVFVTGASGYLGQMLINKLSQEGNIVFAYSRSKKADLFTNDNNVYYYDETDRLNGNIHFGNIDVLIHAGFARPHKSYEEIADSLKFTQELFSDAVNNYVPNIINISSQSVYGTSQPLKWTEESEAMPESPYAQAKYATEIMLNSLLDNNKHIRGTSLRLAALSGGQAGLETVDFLSKMVYSGIKDSSVKMVGGNQLIERLDIRDATDAILSLMKTNSRQWSRVYNLGSGESKTLKGIVNEVERKIYEYYNRKVTINQVENNNLPSFGMDNSKFLTLTKWKPKYNTEDMIETLIKYYK